MHRSWSKLKFWKHHYPQVLSELEKREAQGVSIFPRQEDRLKVFSLPFQDVKVVILGQDPYPTRGHAHGLSFSVQPHIRTVPGSLRNIFNEYEDDLGFPRPRSGDLREWHKRGVLLFNTALTVEENRPESHLHLWSKLTYEVLSKLSRERQGIAFMLWGRKAQEYQALIDESRHLILRAGHPSPFSHRFFLGCKHFSKAATYLKEDPNIFWRLT